MKDNHITDIIDNTPFVDLSDSELQTIHAHAATCVACERAFAAASIASLLIKERTSEAAQQTLNANPFFETRVLAAWREQQAAPGDWSFRRLWSATGAIVASMAATTAALAVPEGKVAVHWEIANGAGERRFRMIWRESGGPLVTEPTRSGFGRRVIQLLTAQALSGEVTHEFLPGGVRWTLDVCHQRQQRTLERTERSPKQTKRKEPACRLVKR